MENIRPLHGLETPQLLEIPGKKLARESFLRGTTMVLGLGNIGYAKISW